MCCTALLHVSCHVWHDAQHPFDHHQLAAAMHLVFLGVQQHLEASGRRHAGQELDASREASARRHARNGQEIRQRNTKTFCALRLHLNPRFQPVIRMSVTTSQELWQPSEVT